MDERLATTTMMMMMMMRPRTQPPMMRPISSGDRPVGAGWNGYGGTPWPRNIEPTGTPPHVLSILVAGVHEPFTAVIESLKIVTLVVTPHLPVEYSMRTVVFETDHIETEPMAVPFFRALLSGALTQPLVVNVTSTSSGCVVLAWHGSAGACVVVGGAVVVALVVAVEVGAAAVVLLGAAVVVVVAAAVVVVVAAAVVVGFGLAVVVGAGVATQPGS